MACCCGPSGCPCDGPPFFDNPANPRFLVRGSRPLPEPITVEINNGPSDIQGTYTLTFQWPSGTGGQAEAIYQSSGYAWRYSAAIPGGALTIGVRFGPTYVDCAANSVACDTQAYVLVNAFGTGFNFFGISGTPAQSTLAGCTLPCGNVTTTYEVTHDAALSSGSAPNSLNLTVTLPTDYNPLP